MSPDWGWVVPTVLGFQVWDAVGWLGQALFTLRVLVQWLSSERAGRSLVPASFWWISLLGSLALLVYVLHRKDPVFLVGVMINTAIYVRNLQLTHTSRSAHSPRSPWLPALLSLALALGWIFWQTGAGMAPLDIPVPWLALGILGQGIWSSRFLIQWYASERAGRSVLPAVFFVVSTLGAVLLLAYAIYRVDWVMMAAFALNPIPYIRNLILIRRQREEDA